MKMEELDYVLVPLGIIIMVIYHLCLCYKVVRHPEETGIGINSINKQIWVQTMMEDTVKNGVCAVQTLRNNIMASTLLVSTSTVFMSVIAVLITSKNDIDHAFMYGNKSELGLSIKFFAIFAFVFLAILLNVQSVRYYNDASNLIKIVFHCTYFPLGAESEASFVDQRQVFRAIQTTSRGFHHFMCKTLPNSPSSTTQTLS